MRLVMVALLAVALTASSVYASNESIAEGMANKAVRGIVNLVTGIVELPVQIYKGFDKGFEPIENEVASKTVGAVLGIFRGVGHAAGRMSWGALELVGFWAANPADNKGVGVPLDAEYAWEEGTQYSIFEPSLEEGVKPVGRKLLRGLGDGLLGIAELPGQTLKGIDEGNALVGLGRGLWFWASRTVYGLGSLYSCIVPNPEDNPGYAFEEQYPWDALSEGTK